MKSRLLDRMTNAEKLEASRAELAAMIAKSKKAGTELPPDSVYHGAVRYYERMVEEEQRLRALAVPAAFTGQKPDTPEAAAARRQVEITRGKDVPGSIYPKYSGGGVTRGSWQRDSLQPG